MIIKFYNGKQLVIPDHLVKFGQETVHFGSHVSWLHEFLSKNKPPTFTYLKGVESMRKLSVCKILEQVRTQYTSYMEPFGGVGIDAMLFGNDPQQTYINDRDSQCLEILRANFPAECISSYDVSDCDQREELLGKNPDLLFVDSNNFTLTTMTKTPTVPDLYRDLTMAAFDHAQKFVLINDCSCFYLKYGKKSFAKYSQILGFTIDSLDEYYHNVHRWWLQVVPDWHLVKIVHFGESSHQLFQREPAPLEVVYLTRADLAQHPVITDIMYDNDTLNLFGDNPK